MVAPIEEHCLNCDKPFTAATVALLHKAPTKECPHCGYLNNATALRRARKMRTGAIPMVHTPDEIRHAFERQGVEFRSFAVSTHTTQTVGLSTLIAVVQELQARHYERLMEARK